MRDTEFVFPNMGLIIHYYEFFNTSYMKSGSCYYSTFNETKWPRLSAVDE